MILVHQGADLLVFGGLICPPDVPTGKLHGNITGGPALRPVVSGKKAGGLQCALQESQKGEAGVEGK